MSDIDQRNSSFWNELCGSSLARSLGISDDSAESLRKFDDWYFDYYPYLFDHIPFTSMRGKKVLEIGLGYGTVAQRLMEQGAIYCGLDIADGPVGMARHRAQLLGVPVDANVGSALAIPYPDDTFDHVVTIGCLHHTGDLAQALREVVRCLKPGGRAMIMVYSALSYRHWRKQPLATVKRWLNPSSDWSNANQTMRMAYDSNKEGEAAPETVFITPREAKSYLQGHFAEVTVTPQNIGEDFPPARVLPRRLANALFQSWLGLDLYIECRK